MANLINIDFSKFDLKNYSLNFEFVRATRNFSINWETNFYDENRA